MSGSAARRALSIELPSPLKQVDVTLKLASGDANLYRYFPFIFQISADAPQAEVGEIRQAFDDVEVTIERIRPAGYRVVIIDFESELSCVPVRAGIGTDQRDLALLIKSIMVRERPASAAGTEIWQRRSRSSPSIGRFRAHPSSSSDRAGRGAAFSPGPSANIQTSRISTKPTGFL